MIELHPTDVAHGGEAVARVDGKAHFVDGAMPGERVLGEVVKETASWARVELREIVAPSAQRVDPPCRHFGTCGGCQWQFADYPAQLKWKQSILAGQLSHLGRIAEPPVRPTVAVGSEYGYRNRVDLEVSDGRPAFHRRRSHDLEPIAECLLLHPVLADLFDRLGDLGEMRRLTLRCATTTGKALAVITGTVPAGVASWGCVVSHRSRGELRPVVGSGTIVETVSELPLRITGDAFFQNNTPGAEVLVGLVREALSPHENDTVLDAYAGGGMFGLTVGRDAGGVIAVESDPLAVQDLLFNAAAAGSDHLVVEATVEEAIPEINDPWDIAVVDPPRDGLGVKAVAAITSAKPRAIAYVSCDPASLARDCRYLADVGYRLDWATPVDMFPQTFHIETVAAFSAG
ncbi:MAG: class I SAM-dependent RNA methyltransferase [Actinomycetota bacterium]